jgi:hypothetical protein
VGYRMLEKQFPLKTNVFLNLRKHFYKFSNGFKYFSNPPQMDFEWFCLLKSERFILDDTRFAVPVVFNCR